MKLKTILAALLLMLAPREAVSSDVVRAGDYDAYWLWAGVKARPELQQAKTVYLLQGEIGVDGDGVVRIKAQGATEPGPHKPMLWLVYRTRSLDWNQDIIDAVARRLARWQAQPGQLAGVQVDFDASTRGLKHYAAFLQRLRQELPATYAISVTGLMDWASQGDPRDLTALSNCVDQVIFQTYRGRETVNDVENYLDRIDRVHIPFLLGLAEGATWSSNPRLAENPAFRGYVVFLRNQH